MALNEEYQSRYEEIQKRKQELQSKESELNTYQQEADKIASEKIPQRRFGSGVTKSVQQQYIQRRKTAQESQKEIQAKKQEISTAKQQLEVYEGEVNKSEAYEYGYKRGLEGEGYIRPTLSAEGRKGYDAGASERQDLQARKIQLEQRNAQLNKFKEEGLKPILNESGQIAGFEDIKNQMSIPIEKIGIVASQSPEQKARYERVGFQFQEQQQGEEKPVLVASLPQKPEGNLNKAEAWLQRQRSQALTDIQRSKPGSFNPKARAIAFASGFGTSLIDFGRFWYEGTLHPIKTGTNIIKGGYKLITDSEVREEVGGNIGRVLYQEPDYALGYVSSEILQAYVTGKAFDYLGGKLEKGYYKLTGTPVKEGKITISAGDEVLDIKLQDKIPTESLGKQVKLAGQEVNAVSGAKDLFGRFFKREVTIMKPIPGQEKLSASTQKLLSNIDDLSPAQISKLNKQIIKETGSKGLLETSFFADPYGRLRPSRLGVAKTETAGALDILSGDFTFSKSKPQAIVFQGTIVETPPANIQKIFSKISKGNKLSALEEAKLLKYQLTPSGSFKTPGFITAESEITLAPGEIIKREKLLARTIIEGKPVDVIKAGITSSSGDLKKLLMKEALTSTEKAQLGSLLTKETGFSYYASYGKPYLSTSKASGYLAVALSSFYSGSSAPTSSQITLSKTSLSLSGSPKPISVSYSPKPTSNPYKPIKPYSYSPLGSYSPPSYSPAPKIYKTPSYTPPKSPPTLTPPVKLPPIKPSYNPSKINKKESNISQAFKTFLIKGGKKQYLPGVRAKGEALKIGETRALSNLRATFGVEEVKGVRTSGSQSYSVSNAFRGYRISKNKKIALKDTFIQRTRGEGGLQGGRLSSIGEIKEIQSYKKKKKR